jgi:DNA-binding IclR family transcriptional regulator
MPANKGRKTVCIQSLDRGLTILHAIASSTQPLSLDELAGLLSVHRSSAFRFAHTLRRRGFLSCPVGKKYYVLGSSMWRISSQYDWGDMLKRIATQRLKLLAIQTSQSAQLAVRASESALIVDSANAKHMITIAAEPGDLLPLHCTAHGKALLAGMDRSQLSAILGNAPLQRFTKITVENIDRLSRDLTVIKKRGFAADEGEYQKGIRCLAAPIRLDDDVIVGSIGIVAACSSSIAANSLFYSEQVCKAARDISEMLTIS